MKKKNLRKEMVLGAVVCAILVLCSAYATIAAEKTMMTTDPDLLKADECELYENLIDENDITKATFGPDPLIADAGGPYEGPIGEPIHFNGSATGGEEPYSWYWNFGDGVGTSTNQNPSYTYNEAGTYTVNLTVTDNSSNNATDNTTATIGNWCLEPYIHTQDYRRIYFQGDLVIFLGEVENTGNVPTPPWEYEVLVNKLGEKKRLLDKGSFDYGLSPGATYDKIACPWEAKEPGLHAAYMKATAGNFTWSAKPFIFYVFPGGQWEDILQWLRDLIENGDLISDLVC